MYASTSNTIGDLSPQHLGIRTAGLNIETQSMPTISLM